MFRAISSILNMLCGIPQQIGSFSQRHSQLKKPGKRLAALARFHCITSAHSPRGCGAESPGAQIWAEPSASSRASVSPT